MYRLYKEEGLVVRTRRRRKIVASARVPLPAAERENQRWSMDFMADQLSDGRRFRVLNVVDQFSRKCVASEARESFPSTLVTEVLDRAIFLNGKPESLTIDNGSEFTSRHFDSWAFQEGIALDFIRPGRPVENGFIESFNRSMRDEFLNMNWFLNLAEVQDTLDEWRREYNTERPHSALGYLAPIEYMAQLLADAEK